MNNYTVEIEKHAPIQYADGETHRYRVRVKDTAGKVVNTGRGFSDIRTANLYRDGVYLGMRAAGVQVVGFSYAIDGEEVTEEHWDSAC